MTDWYKTLKMLTTLETEAELRGDDRASGMLSEIGKALLAAQADLTWLEDKRRRDRERKPKKGVNSTDSAISAQSSESPAPPYVSPLTPEKESQQRAREAQAIQGVNDEMVVRFTAMLNRRMGELWPDVDAFLKRRNYSTWESWLREMVQLVREGSQFVPADLAQVCRDDGALDRPIGSPKGLRIFIGSARQERLNPEPPSRPTRPASDNVNDALDEWASKERKHA